MKASSSWFLSVALLSACASSSDPIASSGSGEGGGASTGGTGGDFAAGGGSPNACGRWAQQPWEPGPDGALGTADDVPGTTRTVQEVDAANFIVRETAFAGPGPDAAWDTADDVIQGDSRVVPVDDSTLYVVTYDGPGADGTWATADDHVVAATWVSRDASKRPLEARTLNDPGPDGKWLTADDAIQGRSLFVYGDGTSQPKILDTGYSLPGLDEVWGTADDEVGIVTRRFDEWGTFASDPGPDGAWATDDDELVSRYEDKRHFESYFQWLGSYAAGQDGAFFTPDDPMTSLAVTTCDGEGLDARFIASPGLDAVWGNGDDLVSTRFRVTGCEDPCNADLPGSPAVPK